MTKTRKRKRKNPDDAGYKKKQEREKPVKRNLKRWML